jgi:hypothetical protein
VDTAHHQRRSPNARRAPWVCRHSPGMTTGEILTLLLALSGALNLAIVAGALARTSGKSLAAAALVGGGAALTGLTVFFAAVAAYR